MEIEKGFLKKEIEQLLKSANDEQIMTMYVLAKSIVKPTICIEGPVEQTKNSGAYSVKEAADILGVSVPTINSLIHTDGFPAFQVGHRWKIPVVGLEKWMSQQCGYQYEEVSK